VPTKPAGKPSEKLPKRRRNRERQSPLAGPFSVITDPFCDDQGDFSRLHDQEKMKMAISELRAIAIAGDNQPLSWLYHVLSGRHRTRADARKLLPQRSTVESDRDQLAKGLLVRILWCLKRPPLGWSNDVATGWLAREIEKTPLTSLLPKLSPKEKAATIKYWVNQTQRKKTRYREGYEMRLSWQEGIKTEKEARQAVALIGEFVRTTSV
jgi:hypothetical protein